MSKESGIVYLVGAGPGDPDLISVRGLRLIRSADVLVYDRLVHPDLVQEAPVDAERIFVGKSPGHHVFQQEVINDILVDRAQRGLRVVRLKGGDPFVFGRGGEECLVLKKAEIPFEVVPGISSAISVPAYAGIPVTHRTLSPMFTVVTGHRCDVAEEADWTALARGGTLVILMGLARLPHIAARLVAGGRASSTPVAVIRAGSTPEQEVVEGTLADIAARSRHLTSPAIIVVGDVVRLRSQLEWVTSAALQSEEGPLDERSRTRPFVHGQQEAERTLSSI